MTITSVDDRSIQAEQMLDDLYEIIEALDRRVPRPERIGEPKIAHEAADLRERALKLIRDIEGTTPVE